MTHDTTRCLPVCAFKKDIVLVRINGHLVGEGSVVTMMCRLLLVTQDGWAQLIVEKNNGRTTACWLPRPAGITLPTNREKMRFIVLDTETKSVIVGILVGKRTFGTRFTSL